MTGDPDAVAGSEHDLGPGAATTLAGVDLTDDAALVAEQERVGSLRPPPWHPPDRPLVLAGCFVAFARGEQGPGRTGDHGWGGAAVVDEDGSPLATAAVPGRAPAPYRPGLLAAREGPMLLAALRAVLDRAPVPVDVVLVDATGLDHPRRAGLARHLGAVLDLPTVGVTHRGLTDRGAPPALVARGDRVDVVHDGEPSAAWVCTATGARPVLAHAAWRTDVDTAVVVVLRTCHPGATTLPGGTAGRTPEPLRQARRVARTARSDA